VSQRAQFRDTVLLRWPSGGLNVAPAPAGVSVALYDVGTSNPISEPIYVDESTPATLTNPLSTDASGSILFWLAGERLLDLVVRCPGFSDVRTTITTDSAGSAIDSGVRTYVQHIMGVIDPGGAPSPASP